MEADMPILHVEVALKERSPMKGNNILPYIENLVQEMDVVADESVLANFENECVSKHVDEVQFFVENNVSKLVSPVDCKVTYHVYRYIKDDLEMETIDEEGSTTAFRQWTLPSKEFKGLWDSLTYESDIKGRLIRYMMTSLLFSDKRVDPNLINLNRLVLLYGPPGTGKTSLCKAVAQKLTVRLSNRYKYGMLIEINSHSLFSKYFSESGKLVMKMFRHIQDCINDPESLVFVLIDEVESLSQSRQSMIGNELGDSLRVVNALLTQLDQIKKYPNVMVLTTSNLLDSIDKAFVDRADLKERIELPAVSAIFKIYSSGITELMDKGIISSMEVLLTVESLGTFRYEKTDASENSLALLEISKKSVGLSARTIRKAPVLVYMSRFTYSPPTLKSFLEALDKCVQEWTKDL